MPSQARIAIALLVLSLTACNRAGMRIPGASLSFPETPVEYRAPSPVSMSLRIDPAVDLRSEHSGEVVASSRWKACRTDPLWATTATSIVGERLLAALSASGAFSQVHADPRAPADLVLVPEVHAFCAQAVGFVYLRVAGISAIRLRIARGDETVFDRKFERVVTDADTEYTGLPIATIEQAMQRAMADSLRELFREAVPELATAAQSWSPLPNKGNEADRPPLTSPQ